MIETFGEMFNHSKCVSYIIHLFYTKLYGSFPWSGIYYFLGNITSHIIHALPYQQLGGTFVVLSDKAKKEVEAYNVPVINLDNKPFKLTRFGYKVKLVHHYTKIDKRLKKTVDYLKSHARVVIFYELYDFSAYPLSKESKKYS